MHVAIWEWEKKVMEFARKAQIKVQSKTQSEAQVEALLFDKAPTEVPAEYFDYSNIFLAENIAEFPKNTGINEHIIKLAEGK